MAKQNILDDIMGHFREGRGTPWATREGVQNVVGTAGNLFELVEVAPGWDVYMLRGDRRKGEQKASGDFLVAGSIHPPFVMEGRCPYLSVLGNDLSVITGYLQEKARTPRAEIALLGIGVAPLIANILALVNDMVLHYKLNTPEIFPGIYQLIGHAPTSPAVLEDGATGTILVGTLGLAILGLLASRIPSAIHDRQAMRDFSSRLSLQAAGYRTIATKEELYSHLLQQTAQPRR
ncbi:hypothetical protein HYV82_03900 [Candidatus Woesearchaeota archaeon]|nr:hypothetical protein [Candidatus Woesearchaeota archaeon]